VSIETCRNCDWWSYKKKKKKKQIKTINININNKKKAFATFGLPFEELTAQKNSNTNLPMS
jgi:hypothetical protein